MHFQPIIPIRRGARDPVPLSPPARLFFYFPSILETEVIGGVGVSGAPGGEKDDACGKAGLDKVADQLK